MNAAASSADMSLSATAWQRIRDRSAILNSPARHHDDPVYPATSRLRWRSRPGSIVRHHGTADGCDRLPYRSPWLGWDLRFYRHYGDSHRLDGVARGA